MNKLFNFVPDIVGIVALRQKQWLQSSREKRSKDKTRPTEFAIA